MDSQCYGGYWGNKCEMLLGNCYNCDKNNGFMNIQCLTGYWGDQCDIQCSKCFNCDRSTGCMNGHCYNGYWGEECDKDCHCLNNAACAKETGKCNVDIATGLGPCAPGYVSDTGVNLDNCQMCKCFFFHVILCYIFGLYIGLS